METIKVTFPTNIPKEKIIFILEGNLKQNSKYTCKVEFDRFEDDEISKMTYTDVYNRCYKIKEQNFKNFCYTLL